MVLWKEGEKEQGSKAHTHLHSTGEAMCSRNIGAHLGTGKDPIGLLELQSDGQPVLAASVIKVI